MFKYDQMSIEAMTSWRLKPLTDTTRRAGQGELPKAYSHRKGDQLSELPWGSIVETRQACTYPFEFNGTEQKFLVHLDFLVKNRRHV